METNELPTRYRIHIKPKDGYYTRREEYKETMRELGWEYVGQLHYRADVYRATRPDAVEINTDENALRESIKAANRGELCAGIVLILLIPWLLRNELRYMKPSSTWCLAYMPFFAPSRSAGGICWTEASAPARRYTSASLSVSR